MIILVLITYENCAFSNNLHAKKEEEQPRADKVNQAQPNHPNPIDMFGLVSFGWSTPRLIIENQYTSIWFQFASW